MRERAMPTEPPPSSRREVASARGGQPASSRVALRRLALRLRAEEPRPSAPLTLRDFIAMPPEQRPLFVVSDGIGVDSTAMLVGLWRLGLRPDVVLHADTGDEHPATVAYREHRRAWLRSIGFPDLTIVRRPPSRSKKTGRAFSTLGEKCLANETLPSLAFGGKACSVEWKIRPQEQWLKRYEPAQRTWASGHKVVKAIGYDAGPLDSRRAHDLTSDAAYDYVYPLREWLWDRARAAAEIRAAGLPVPRKSACVFCPASKPWEIAELVRDWPEIADRIVEIEDTARPHLREVEGLWRKAIKGMRGAVARPGSMALFIRALRADPALLRRYLDMAPAEPIAVGDDIGAVPTFKGAPASVSKRRRLPLAPAARAPEPTSWALAGGVA
jgi:hypothetical protein